MKTCGIYKITNLINNKMYIGQSINIKKRLKQHQTYLKCNKHYNRHLQYAWNKYGKDAFKFEVYIECKPDELNDWEIFLIKAHDLMNDEYGYNVSFGGEYGLIGHKASEETRLKLSEAHKGKSSNMLGKYHTDETKLKMSESHKGIKLSKETCNKMSESRKGNKHPLYGKKHSEETRKKMSLGKKGVKRGKYNKRSK